MVRAVATSPAVRRAVLISVSLTVLGQLSGVNNALNFSSSFLRANGLSDEACNLAAISMNLANVLVVALCAPLMDAIGRRPLTLLG